MITLWQKTMLASMMVVALGVPATFAHEEAEEGVVEVAPAPGQVHSHPLEHIQRAIFGHVPPTALGGPTVIRRVGPMSPYYIGVALNRVSDQLRAHVDLPEGVGLIVTHVFEESPATEADLKQHDILLRADGEDLKRIEDLTQVVNDHSGENNRTQFTLDIVRRGQRQTLWVTPAVRPTPPAIERPAFPEVSPEERRMLERMRVRDGRLNFDAFRPIRPVAPQAVAGPESTDDLQERFERMQQEMRELREQLEAKRQE